jgi:hypothetical protein
MADEPYATIREVLAAFIGQTVVDITQHDEADFVPGGPSDIYLHFSNGHTLHFLIDDKGFETMEPGGGGDEGG